MLKSSTSPEGPDQCNRTSSVAEDHRPEVDIQHVFDTLTQSSYIPYDLATDQDASADLRAFARSQRFGGHASASRHQWPEEMDFNGVTSRANDPFIFIQTLVPTHKRCGDPQESLKGALQDSASTAWNLDTGFTPVPSKHKLYTIVPSLSGWLECFLLHLHTAHCAMR